MESVRDFDEEVLSLLEQGTPVLLPDVNRSGKCMMLEDDSLRLGLDSVWGLSEQDVETILREREQAPFSSFCDFLSRIPFIHRNSDGIDNLIRCGAFDSFGIVRTSLLDWKGGENAQKTLEKLDAYWNQEKQFSLNLESQQEDAAIPESKALPRVFAVIEERIGVEPAQEPASLLREMENRALMHHPVELQLFPYNKALRLFYSKKTKERNAVRYGRIRCIEELSSADGQAKRGSYVVKAILDEADCTYRIRFSTKKTKFKELKLSEGCLVRMRATPKSQHKSTVYAESIQRMLNAREIMRKATVELQARDLTPVTMYKLKNSLEYCRGIDSVCLDIHCGDERCIATLPAKVNVSYPAFRASLHEIFEDVKIKVSFDEDIY